MEVIAASLRPKGGEILDLQVPGLFKVVIVGNDVGAFLPEGGTG
jgi:hypothetical protein